MKAIGPTHLSWHNERDGLDAVGRKLIRTGDLALRDVERAAGEEAHAALGVGRLVFGEGVKGVGFVLEVADVAVTVRI